MIRQWGYGLYDDSAGKRHSTPSLSVMPFGSQRLEPMKRGKPCSRSSSTCTSPR